jgi:M6 family metalloprotease-like protein
MKKVLFFTYVLLITCLYSVQLYAVKAFPDPINIQQPDGSTISVLLHGDEFFHYQTTDDGYLIKQNEKGYYRYATVNASGGLVESAYNVHEKTKRTLTEQSFLKGISPSGQIQLLRKAVSTTSTSTIMRAKSSTTSTNAFPLTGTPKSLVILVNFSDNSFSSPTPQADFTNLLNQAGYSANGGTGSAKDYFQSSSFGKFSPVFDVVGPYTLSHPLAYYGKNDISGNDTLPRQMVIDACAKASAAGVDFSQYDLDNDGFVDNIFIYYAGYNEAEGGGSNANTIWPHRWSLANYSTKFNNKIVFDYACTSELKGLSGTNMCGVGTFCHEFGHVLGLPDYYDTSGATHNTLSNWDIMSSGNYNNSGRTPPTYSCYDRFFLGWLTPQQVSSASNLTLLPLYQGTTQPANTNQQSYLLSATTHNLNGASPNPTEFFMVEYRKQIGWDYYLPAEGMCVWHIDYNQSDWTNNIPNNYSGTTQTYASHMRVYLQPLSGSAITPGTAFTSGSFTPTTWSGTDINRAITSITKTTDNVTFKLMGGSAAVIPVISSTTAITAITSATAASGGTISSDGGAAVTSRGVCWNTSQNPTTSNSITSDGTGTGSFSSSLTGLTAGTLYYVRAYATNSAGTSYGNQVSFLYTNTDKNVSDFAAPTICDIAISSGTKFTSNAAGQTVHSVTVMPGGSLDLTNLLTVTSDLILKADNGSSFSVNVGSGLTVGGNVKYVKTLDDAHWYFLSFPCNVSISGISKSDGSSLGILGTDWFIETYNGLTRASNSGTTSNWDDITNSGATLEAYKGYAIGLKTGVGPYDVSFPLQSSLLASESARTVPVVAYGYGTAAVAQQGWNLIGQPYLSKYNSGYAGVPYMLLSGDATAQTYNTLSSSSPQLLNPFTAFFVQADNILEASQVSFATTGRQLSRAVAVQDRTEIQLNLTTTTGTDNTNLIFDDNQTTSYVIGQDMEKWIGVGTDKPQIYTVLDGVNYAFNALPVGSVVNLPLGYYSKTTSNSTISINSPTTSGLSQLLLTDKTNGIITDLLTSPYSFNISAGTNNTRFVLKAKQVSADNIQTPTNGPTLRTIDGKLIVEKLSGKTDIRIYNSIGQLIVNDYSNASTFEIKLPINHVYNLRLSFDSKVMTYKFINR